MSSEFVDLGFVDTGFVSSVLSIDPHQHWTDFREYRRGRLPSDWTERWTTGGASLIEGGTYDMQHRSVLQLNGLSTVATRLGLSWNAVDNDTGIANQEVLIRLRPLASTANNYGAIPVLRGSGSAGTENCYRVVLFDNGTWQLSKFVAGVSTVLSTCTRSFLSGSIYWVRFRANGTTIQARVWNDGDVEPSTWVSDAVSITTLTDASIATGWVGVHLPGSSSCRTEIQYFEVVTNGGSSIGQSGVSDPLDKWLSEPDEDLEMTVRFEYYNPLSDVVESIWFSSHGRSTSPSDYPQSTDMDAVLADPGSLAYKLEADNQFAGVIIPSLSPLKLNNLPSYPGGPGPLDLWPTYSFYGRPVEIRLGRRWLYRPTVSTDGVLNPHRRFEIIGCAVTAQEPDVGTDQVSIQISSPVKLLSDTVPVYHNVGIPTGIKSLSTSGWLSIPASTSYNLTSFAIYTRIFVPAGGIAGTGYASFTRCRDAGSLDQWNIAVYHASSSTSPHNLWVSSYNATGTLLLSYTLLFTPYYGRWVDVVLGIDGSNRWYLLVDGQRVTGGTLAANPRTNAGSTVNLLRTSVSGCTCDHRIESFVSEDEALSRFSTRREPDPITISMHRCDDSLGSTVTDYALLANHGTLQGTDAVDRSWVATYLGAEQLVGLPMPLSAGVVYHAPTQPIDSVRELFRYNDRVRTTGSTVEIRAKGLILTGGGTNYSEPTDGPGTVDIVGASDQPVTFGLKSTSTTPEDVRTHIVQTVRDDLVTRGVLSASNADLDSFSALRQLLPMRGGYHYDQPPTVSDLLTGILAPLGGYFSLDHSGRLSVGSLLPPVNPGPYGQESLLEFLGYPNRGVTFGPSSTYALNNGTTWGLMCWVKLHRLPIDKSATLGTYFPTGQTLIDRVDPSTASGYYLGFDGRTGEIVFGAPGVTVTTGSGGSTTDAGNHYTRRFYNWQPETWYLITTLQDGNTRKILIDPLGLADNAAPPFDFTTGSLTVPTNAPLRIGHGPQGSLVGSISYAAGYSNVDTDTQRLHWKAGRPVLATETTLRWLATLTDGNGSDTPYDSKNLRYGRVEGCRWSPRLLLDFRSAAGPTFPGIRRSIPAWKVIGTYKTNLSPLSGADVVASVSASDRIAIGQPYLSESSSSQTTQANYLNSRLVNLPTPLLSATDSDTVVSMIRGRLSTDRRLADALNWYRESIKLSPTDEVVIYDDRFAANGRPARVATLAARLGDLRGDVGTWG